MILLILLLLSLGTGQPTLPVSNDKIVAILEEMQAAQKEGETPAAVSSLASQSNISLSPPTLPKDSLLHSATLPMEESSIYYLRWCTSGLAKAVV